MADLNDVFRSAQKRGLIRRILPILIRDYSVEEVNQIKYSIHFQLLLGLEVIVVFTDRTEYLHEQLGSDILVVVQKMTLIDSDSAYDEDAPISLAVVTNRFRIDDVYRELNLLTKRETSAHLRYGRFTFTSARINTHRQYRDLLFCLQGGKCAITGDPLVSGYRDIDHLYPVEHGGNNSLINLRATTRRSNQTKRDEITEPRYCFSPDQLRAYTLDSEFYRLVADRTLKGIPVGSKALFGRNLRTTT